MDKKTVADLGIGEKGIIKNLKDQDLSLKLLEMGCVPGSEVEVSQRAPFGGPICIYIHETSLSMRLEEAVLIEVV